MFEVEKTVRISCAHSLKLGYKSPCNNVHGHNYKITVFCRSESLNKYDMVVDFKHIKDVPSLLDHQNLNEAMSHNPTTERLAEWICSHVTNCWKVRVEETDDNVAVYIK